jgi:hypothetical protein
MPLPRKLLPSKANNLHHLMKELLPLLSKKSLLLRQRRLPQSPVPRKPTLLLNLQPTANLRQRRLLQSPVPRKLMLLLLLLLKPMALLPLLKRRRLQQSPVPRKQLLLLLLLQSKKPLLPLLR